MWSARSVGVSLVFAAVSACGGTEHAPLLSHDPFNPLGFDAGTGGVAGAGGTDGGTLPTSGAGGDDTGGSFDGKPADPLDPAAVYLFGTLMEGNGCEQRALAPILDPNTYSVGFACDAPNRLTINHGWLYYELLAGTEIHKFVPDSDSKGYPADPFENDIKINAPCPLIQGYVVSPSGKLIYHCISMGWLTVGAGKVYDGSDDILAVTDGDLVATTGGVMDLNDPDHVITPVPDLMHVLGGVRVHDETFHYVLADSPLSAGVLWSVDATGKPKKLGTYPLPPSGVRLTGPLNLTVPILAPDDTFVASGFDAQNIERELLFARTIDGTRKIVYTEGDNPSVTMHAGSPLITGP